MSSRTTKGGIYLFLLILIFGLAGGAIGEILGQSIHGLAFLKNSFQIGMPNPLTIDLKLIALTFGLNFKVNIMSLVGMLIGFIIYKKF